MGCGGWWVQTIGGEEVTSCSNLGQSLLDERVRTVVAELAWAERSAEPVRERGLQLRAVQLAIVILQRSEQEKRCTLVTSTTRTMRKESLGDAFCLP